MNAFAGIANAPSSPKIFQAVVDSSDATTYVHVIAPTEKNGQLLPRMQAIPLYTAFANLFGFKQAFLIPAGTKVLAIQTEASLAFILGIVPDGDVGVEDYAMRTVLGAGDGIVMKSQKVGYDTDTNKSVLLNVNRPTDVVGGENVIANDFGVMLGLFQLMATLKASDLAQVQCHLMDDMVRIISLNFEHMTALGSYKIFQDGDSISAEFEATASVAESMGIPEIDEKSDQTIFEEGESTKADDTEEFYKIQNERTQAIARFKMYLGKLGDFINFFISKPSGAGSALDGKEPTEFDTGLLQGKMSTDGGFYLRSTKEIFIEKVAWIRVPQRIRTPEDPKGAKDVTFEPKEEFEFDNTHTIDDNPFLHYLQLRDYVAYVTEGLNYQTFKEHKGDFAVNDQFDSQSDTYDNVDPFTPTTNLQDYKLRTSGIYLMQNGGIVQRDAWGSSIVMEGGDIYLQPADSLVMMPLKNLIAKVGQFVSIAAKNDIDFSSTDKGIRFKSELALYMFSNKSGIVLESNGESTVAAEPEGEAIERTAGIILKGKKGIFAHAEDGAIGLSAKKAILGKSDGDIRWFADDYVQMTGTKGAVLNSSEEAGIFTVNDAVFVVSTGACIVGGQQSTIIGQEDTNLGIKYDDDSPFVDVLKGLVDLSDFINIIGDITVASEDAFEQAAPFSTTEEFDKVKFRFLTSEKYELADDKAIPASTAQIDGQSNPDSDLQDWEEISVNDTLPFPGTEKFDSYYITFDSYKNVEYKPGKGFVNKANPENTTGNIKVTSLKEYKVR